MELRPYQRRHIPFLPDIFFGWWILIAGVAIMMLVGTINTYGLGLFSIPLMAQFGWSRAQLSGGLSLSRLEGGLVGPIEGILVDRFGPRVMMFIGVPLIALGFYMLSRLEDLISFTGWDSLVLFYIIYVLFITLGGSLGTGTAANTAIANWFVRRRGMAIGIISSGIGWGAGLWVPVIGYVIEHYSWQQASYAATFAVLAIGLPAAAVMRHRPEKYGYLPDGDTPESLAAEAARPPEQRRYSAANEENFTLRQAIRTRAFWIMAFAFSIRVAITSAVTLHMVPLLQDLGYSLVVAAYVSSAQAILSNVGRIGIGSLGDGRNKKAIYIMCLCGLLVGVIAFAYATDIWQIALFLLLYGPAYGGMNTLAPSLRGEYFGRHHFGSIGGAMGPINTLGTVSGPLFAGFMWDRTGSYKTSMLIFAGLVVIDILLMSFLTHPHLSDVKESTPAPVGG